jgi:hypothetical protein
LYTAPISAADNFGITEFDEEYRRSVSAAFLSARASLEKVVLNLTYLGDDIIDATPVIVPPASATLFLGGAASDNSHRAVLMFDHRTVNGLEASEYLRQVEQELRLLTAFVERRSRDDSIELRENSPEVRRRASDDWAAEVVGGVVGCEVDLDAAISELGLSSLMIVAIARELSDQLGKVISPAVFFQHPSLRGVLNEAVDETISGGEAASIGAAGRRGAGGGVGDV